MSDRVSSGWLALLTATRLAAVRAGFVVLMLVSVFGSRASTQLPNCSCDTLWFLCDAGANYQSCDYCAALDRHLGWRPLAAQTRAAAFSFMV
jgi:hypothetical protein